MQPTAPGPSRNKWLILIIVITLTFMSSLDGSIVNVALPTMAVRLNTSLASISWIVTAYLIIISAVILLFGRLSEARGKTNIFTFGVILFTVGSLMCGLSPAFWMLVLSRMVQAVGAAAAMATNQGIIVQAFPSGERGKALGWVGSSVALGGMLGPPLGGFIVSAVSWHYIFLINVPIGVAAFILGLKYLPRQARDAARVSETLDWKGIAFFALAIIPLFCALNVGQVSGYLNAPILSAFALSAVSFALFVWWERRAPRPMLDLAIFKNRLFSLSIFCIFICFTGTFSINIMLPFYLQNLLRMTPGAAGLIILASPVVLALVAPLSGRASDRIGSEMLTFIGLSILTLGLAGMGVLYNQTTAIPVILAFIALASLGNGMFQSPNTSLIMSTVPPDRLGIAGSVNGLMRNMGMVFGTSFATSLFYNRLSRAMGSHVDTYEGGHAAEFVYAMRTVFFACAAICLLGVVVTAVRLYARRPVAADKGAAQREGTTKG